MLFLADKIRLFYAVRHLDACFIFFIAACRVELFGQDHSWRPRFCVGSVRPLIDMYGNTPIELEEYKLNFGILCVSLRDGSDEWIVSMRAHYWTFLFLPRRREDTKRSVHLLQNFAPSCLSGYTKGPVVWHAGHDVKLFKIYFRETLISADENELMTASPSESDARVLRCL
jgi:hypothetical protein